MHHHQHIRKLLLLYLDGDLSERDRASVREHLDGCPSCRRHLESLSLVWPRDGVLERATPPPYLWTRVEARIREVARPRPLMADIMQTLSWAARPAVMVAVLIAGVMLGAYLGNIPASEPVAENGNVTVALQEGNGAATPAYLENFTDMPPESVARAYMLVAADDQGGRR